MAADTNDDLPPLDGKAWLDYRLNASEWRLIQMVHDCLKVGTFMILATPDDSFVLGCICSP
jgi:hypothetical protein